ncbi:MAG: adenosylcobinamide amidohydrolase [Bacilli bacterium]
MVRINTNDEGTYIDFGNVHEVLSGAMQNGGLSRATGVYNMYVPFDFRSDDPLTELRAQMRRSHVDESKTVGLMTAVPMKCGAYQMHMVAGAQCFIYVTAGVSNGVCAGRASQTFDSVYTPGTINSVVLFSGNVCSAAKLQLYATLVESKTVVLRAFGFSDEQGHVISGTSTDCLALATPDFDASQPYFQFAGTATELGHEMSVAYEAVLTKALERYTDDRITSCDYR